MKLANRIGASITTIHCYELPALKSSHLPRTTRAIYETMSLEEFDNYKDNVPHLRAIAEEAGLDMVPLNHIMKEGEADASLTKTSTKPFAIGSGEFTRPNEAVAGFNLNIKRPLILPEEKVDMQLSLSVRKTVGDPPETSENLIKTGVVIKSGESAAIGGVVANQSASDFDRNAPFGSDEIEDGFSAD